MPTDTLLLNRSTVQAVVDIDQLTEQLGSALLGYVGAGDPQRVRSRLSAELTAMVLMPGLADGVPAYTVKVHAKNPDADEAIRGLMLLHDLPGGALLAAIDSGWLTEQRTALTAAFVHDRLTSHSPGSTAIIGAGAQGTAAALALSRRRGGHFTIYDSDQRRALALQQALGVAHADVAPSSEAAVRASSSAVTATWGRDPVASTSALQRLDHVTVLGMDEPGKQELPPDFLDMATVYADDPALIRPIIQQKSVPISAALREDARQFGRASMSPLVSPSKTASPRGTCINEPAPWAADRISIFAGRCRHRGSGNAALDATTGESLNPSPSTVTGESLRCFDHFRGSHHRCTTLQLGYAKTPDFSGASSYLSARVHL